MSYDFSEQIDFQGGLDVSRPPLSGGPPALDEGSWNAIVSGTGFTRPWSGATSQGAGTGSEKMFPFGNTWGGIKEIGGLAAGSFFQDIGKSRWGIGIGTPHIEGTNVSGFTLSTNLQLQIATAGSYASPVQAGLGQPSAPTVGVIESPGDISNPMSVKIERSRPATGAKSLASPVSAVVVPQANRLRVTFPVASTGQTHWRVFFTFQGFGGNGIHYLGNYLTHTDIPEATVAAGTVGGAAAQATGTLFFSGNPSNGETIVVNGVTTTFRTTAPAAGEVQIGATAAATATNLAAVLGLSDNILLSVASYSANSTTLTVTYGASGTTGNGFTLNNSSFANVVRSGATLSGGLAGDFTRSLEFNFKDGDLIPIEASFDDYPPPAATHALRLQTVLNLIGCYSDSTSSPTSASPGTAIAVSKENNYESYVPTSLLFLPEQVVDCLARPIDDYGYIACGNSIHALQYVGNRGDELPSCTLTTILPDIGIEYAHNWCHFRGRLLIYAAQGNLMMMDESGSFDSEFAGPVAKLLKGFTTATTAVGYDPKNDSLVVLNGKKMLVYSLAARQWRQIWLPDYSITGTAISCTTAKRTLYFSLTSGGTETAYSYDTGTATAPITFCSDYQGPRGSSINDIFEMAVAAQTSAVSEALCVVLNRNLAKTVFRQITTNGTTTLIDVENSFTPDMVGKRGFLFGSNVDGIGGEYLGFTIAAYVNSANVTISANRTPPAGERMMFVGNFAQAMLFTATKHLPNVYPNMTEVRSYQAAVWLKATGDAGNVLSLDLMGTTYPSSRSL